MSEDLQASESIDRLRSVCLEFPEAYEQETWGHPTFRVRKKMFAACGIDDSGRASVTMKADPDEHAPLLAVGHPFFLPAYVGTKGWIGVWLDSATDWRDIAELLTTSYQLISPKTLSAQVEEPPTLPWDLS